MTKLHCVFNLIFRRWNTLNNDAPLVNGAVNPVSDVGPFPSPSTDRLHRPIL
ncbi:unnamed protein product, partial [Nesidiocoris tenuis]